MWIMGYRVGRLPSLGHAATTADNVDATGAKPLHHIQVPRYLDLGTYRLPGTLDSSSRPPPPASRLNVSSLVPHNHSVQSTQFWARRTWNGGPTNSPAKQAQHSSPPSSTVTRHFIPKPLAEAFLFFFSRSYNYPRRSFYLFESVSSDPAVISPSPNLGAYHLSRPSVVEPWSDRNISTTATSTVPTNDANSPVRQSPQSCHPEALLLAPAVRTTALLSSSSSFLVRGPYSLRTIPPTNSVSLGESAVGKVNTDGIHTC